MKIVHVLTVPDSLLFLRGQPEFMASRGHELAVITSPGPALDAFAAQANIDHRGVAMHRGISPLRDVGSLTGVTKALREFQPDIVHAHTPKGGLMGMLGSKALGIPKRVYHLRGMVFETAMGRRRTLLKAVEKLTCLLATDVICVSASLRSRALEERLVSPAKIKVIGHGSGQGVDTKRFTPANNEERQASRQALKLTREDVVFLFVGRLVGDKGIEELTEAWQAVSQAVPNARLLVVGKSEPRDTVRQTILDELRADPSVTLCGFLSDTRSAYRAADVVVLPSRREGFPNVPLEGAAMGLPVITTDATGCIDSVEAGTTGILVPVRQSDALAKAMIRYGNDAALRQRHGAAGRLRVVEHYQPRGIWEGIASVYDA